MKIFVGEFVCGGGFLTPDVQAIPTSLRAEGGAMLRALVEDLSGFAKVRTLCDPRLRDEFEFENVEVLAAVPGEALWRQWFAAANDCDFAVIVAPENDGTLAQGVAMLRAAGVDVIAGSGDFLRVASDKWLTAKAMSAGGVPHPPTWTKTHQRGFDRFNDHQGFILKPRDGCGTTEIRKVNSMRDALAEATDGDVIQPLLPGRAVSVSLVAGPSGHTFLPAVTQSIDTSDWTYGGGIGPLDDDSQRRAQSIASLALEAMPPSARGFVGFDLLLGEGPGQDFLIEVNPRLTTSYVGLRKMIHGNISARLFDLETGPVQCRVAAESIRWTADGVVTEIEHPIVTATDPSSN